MRTAVAALALLLPLVDAVAAPGSGRYSCTAGKHELSFDFGKKVVTLDDKSDTLTEGAATWRGKPGGVPVIIGPTDKMAQRIFDVSINSGVDYSGFLICKSY